MITTWIQDFVGHLMADKLAPAVTRTVTRALPSASPTTVENMVDQLFNPNYAKPNGGRTHPGTSQ